MHINAFDHYLSRDSLIHRLDPRVKVVVTVLYILSNVVLPDGAWLAFGAAWGMVLLGNSLAQVGWSYSFRRSFIVLPFMLAAVTIIFTLPGRPLIVVQVGPWLLAPTDAGLLRFTSILIRAWLSVQMAILLTVTTQFPDLMHALRHLRLPATLVAIISFMVRYLFVLSDEVLRLLRAREARSARLDNYRSGSILWRAKVAGNMAGQLFLRSYDRSDRIYQAMLARGYRGHFLTLNPHQLTGQDWLLGGVILLLLVLIQMLGRLVN